MSSANSRTSYLIRREPVWRTRRSGGAFSLDIFIVLTPLATLLLLQFVNLTTDVAFALMAGVLFACTVAALLNRLVVTGVRQQIASTVLILGFALWYAYPALVSAYVDAYQYGPEVRSYATDVVTKSFAILTLFLCAMVIAVHLLGNVFRTGTARPIERALVRRRLVLLVISACFIGLLPYVVLGGSLSTVVAGIAGGRSVEKAWLHTENLGNSTSSLTYLASSALVAGGSLLLLIGLDRGFSPLARGLAFGTGAAVAIIIYFDHGTRSLLLLMIAPLFGVVLMGLWQKSAVRTFIMLVVMSIVLFSILQFQLVYRIDYTRANASRLWSADWYALSGTLDYFKETLFAASIVPSLHGYFRESALLHFVVSPVPRVLWPDKPVSEVVRFFTLVRWHRDILTGGGNTFPGIVGQYYMSWGWYGPLMIGIGLGGVGSWIDRYLADALTTDALYKIGLGFMAAMYLLLSYRVLSPGFLYPVLFVALLLQLSHLRTSPG